MAVQLIPTKGKIKMTPELRAARAAVGAFLSKLQARGDLDPYHFFGASASLDVAEPTLRPGWDDNGLAIDEVIWPFTQYKNAWNGWKLLTQAFYGSIVPFPPTDEERYKTTKDVRLAIADFLGKWDATFKSGPDLALLLGIGIGVVVLGYVFTRKGSG